MSNGFVDMFKMAKLQDVLNEVIKIRKKYGKSINNVRVSNRISLEFHKTFNVVRVIINGNKCIKYDYGNVSKLAKSFSTGITAGILNGPLSFETKDKTAMTKAFVDGVTNEIKANLSSVENQFKCVSSRKWF